MRSSLFCLFVFLGNIFPFAAHARQLRLHPPSREDRTVGMTAPPLLASPEYTRRNQRQPLISLSPESEESKESLLPRNFERTRTWHASRAEHRLREAEPRTRQAFSVENRTAQKQCTGPLVEKGVASWYGPGFHGHTAANGKPYNQYALTIAHRTLPLNSWKCVYNPKNGHSVIVKVTDRGPYKYDHKFHQNRKFDLSLTVAQILDITRQGTEYVEVYDVE